MQSYEVEVKSLLGSREQADALRARMQELDPATKQISTNKQLNHYFIGGDLKKLATVVAPILSPEARAKFDDLAAKATDFSLRTRDKNGTTLLVLKASVGDDTSANGVSRIEFEEKVGISLDALDKMLLDAGFTYQAKWSREREEYAFKGATVCLDHNAGYGWLAEFEKVVGDANEVDAARDSIHALMAECGVEELPQDRLERMFAFYNEHWPEYYGTDKIFTIQ
ncbi:MAG TPA: CYTH domain-containing protein [Candidatus Paceibacterota bacterium]|nr:CYTH domain-containing protein [Candidatus Paceibacterota bacterium]